MKKATEKETPANDAGGKGQRSGQYGNGGRKTGGKTNIERNSTETRAD